MHMRPQQGLWLWGSGSTEAVALNWGWAWAPLCFDALVTRRPGFPEKVAPSHGCSNPSLPHGFHLLNHTSRSWGLLGVAHTLKHARTHLLQIPLLHHPQVPQERE